MPQPVTWHDCADDDLRERPDAATQCGVNFRTMDGRWRVAMVSGGADVPASQRRWMIWDMRGARPRPALPGVSFAAFDAATEACERRLMSSVRGRILQGLLAVTWVHARSWVAHVRDVLGAEVPGRG